MCLLLFANISDMAKHKQMVLHEAQNKNIFLQHTFFFFIVKFVLLQVYSFDCKQEANFNFFLKSWP